MKALFKVALWDLGAERDALWWSAQVALASTFLLLFSPGPLPASGNFLSFGVALYTYRVLFLSSIDWPTLRALPVPPRLIVRARFFLILGAAAGYLALAAALGRILGLLNPGVTIAAAGLPAFGVGWGVAVAGSGLWAAVCFATGKGSLAPPAALALMAVIMAVLFPFTLSVLVAAGPTLRSAGPIASFITGSLPGLFVFALSLLYAERAFAEVEMA